jgi:hypothetical protein
VQEAAALMYNAAQEECEALRKKRDELANEIAMLREKNSKLEQALKKQKQYAALFSCLTRCSAISHIFSRVAKWFLMSWPMGCDGNYHNENSVIHLSQARRGDACGDYTAVGTTFTRI